MKLHVKVFLVRLWNIACRVFLRSDVLHVGEHVIWKDSHRRRMDLWHVQSCRDENSALAESAPMRQKRLSNSGRGEFWCGVSRVHRKRRLSPATRRLGRSPLRGITTRQ